VLKLLLHGFKFLEYMARIQISMLTLQDRNAGAGTQALKVPINLSI